MTESIDILVNAMRTTGTDGRPQPRVGVSVRLPPRVARFLADEARALDVATSRVVEAAVVFYAARDDRPAVDPAEVSRGRPSYVHVSFRLAQFVRDGVVPDDLAVLGLPTKGAYYRAAIYAIVGDAGIQGAFRDALAELLDRNGRGAVPGHGVYFGQQGRVALPRVSATREDVATLLLDARRRGQVNPGDTDIAVLRRVLRELVADAAAAARTVDVEDSRLERGARVVASHRHAV